MAGYLERRSISGENVAPQTTARYGLVSCAVVRDRQIRMRFVLQDMVKVGVASARTLSRASSSGDVRGARERRYNRL